MALPKLLQKLFQNNGAGPKLREDIIPIDTALSATSTNAVQNKVINSALDGKLSLTGGTMTGGISFTGDGKIINATSKGGDLLIHQRGVSLHGSNVDWRDGASLLLRSSTFADQEGQFRLLASLSSSQYCELIGKPDGSLTWGLHNVLSVVAESYGNNSWYRKYSDGWLEQGLVFTSTGSKNWATPFISSPYTVLASSTINPTVSSTSITVSDMNYGPSTKQSKIYVYACGK